MLERLQSYSLSSPLAEDAVRATREATFTDENGTERRAWLDIVSLSGSTDEMRERFTEDAEAATRLRHEALVPLIDHGEDAGFAFTVYEVHDAVPLDELIESAPDRHLDAELVALIGADLAGGLAYAHGRRPALVHGALSPSVIEAHADGQVRLRGWAARALWRSVARADGTLEEATAYLSPEAVQQRRTTQRSDLFSLGSVLYEALIGCRAFDAPTALATGIKIRMASYVSLEVAQPDAPAPLRETLSALLRAEPSKRPDPMSVRNALWAVVRDERALRERLRGRFSAVAVPSPPAAFAEPVDPEAQLLDGQPTASTPFDDAKSSDLVGASSLDHARGASSELDSTSAAADASAAPTFATAEPTMLNHVAPEPLAAEPTRPLAWVGAPAVGASTGADSRFGPPPGPAVSGVTSGSDVGRRPGSFNGAPPPEDAVPLSPENEHAPTVRMRMELPPGFQDPLGHPSPQLTSPSLSPRPVEGLASPPSSGSGALALRFAALGIAALGLVILAALLAALLAG